MAKYGIEIRLDVSKIDKSRLHKGNKGTYLTMTTFVDVDNKDQYDNNGMLLHKTKQDEDSRRLPILGNVKVFWKGESSPQKGQSTQAPSIDDFDSSDIPFS